MELIRERLFRYVAVFVLRRLRWCDHRPETQGKKKEKSIYCRESERDQSKNEIFKLYLYLNLSIDLDLIMIFLFTTEKNVIMDTGAIIGHVFCHLFFMITFSVPMQCKHT